MSQVFTRTENELLVGVMLNAYPDSIGHNLSDIVSMLKKPEFKDVFSFFYILPTFFNSDLDRGFSIIDYDLNRELVSPDDLEELHQLNIMLKLDLVLNHLSVGSPQFQNMLKDGDQSEYKDFFIDWDEFWQSEGEMGDQGYIVPREDHLEKLFMRKPGLPILKIRFPNGSERHYWNTFYQEVTYQKLTSHDLDGIDGISDTQTEAIVSAVNKIVEDKEDLDKIDLGPLSSYKDQVISIVERKSKYLGQMDLNAKSEKVWDFYDETLSKLHHFGGKLIRLDAFAYLHKKPGEVNFFNRPGTWEYLERLRQMAKRHELTLLPEIHAEFGQGLHEEVAGEGFLIYDFFFPGLVINALHCGTNKHLLCWIKDILEKNMKTINMLGCHDGIPVLDLKGKMVNGVLRKGLLSDEEVDDMVDLILKRGGRVKNLYGPDGKKISYYQVNTTFFSALGESEKSLCLARAIQMFMPGIPQVWYLDLFAGKNDYEAADKAGTAGHKEINRTTLTGSDIEQGLQSSVVQNQLELMRLRNTCPAFGGHLEMKETDERLLELTWMKGTCRATLKADLGDHSFNIIYMDDAGHEKTLVLRELEA